MFLPVEFSFLRSEAAYHSECFLSLCAFTMVLRVGEGEGGMGFEHGTMIVHLVTVCAAMGGECFLCRVCYVILLRYTCLRGGWGRLVLCMYGLVSRRLDGG